MKQQKQNNDTMINTTKLNARAGNAVVLAKKDGNAYKYSNLKQAHKRKAKLMEEGIECRILDRGRVKYIQVK